MEKIIFIFYFKVKATHINPLGNRTECHLRGLEYCPTLEENLMEFSMDIYEMTVDESIYILHLLDQCPEVWKIGIFMLFVFYEITKRGF